MDRIYGTDFNAWANQQAALLRAGRLDAADIENIGRSETRDRLADNPSLKAALDQPISAAHRLGVLGRASGRARDRHCMEGRSPGFALGRSRRLQTWIFGRPEGRLRVLLRLSWPDRYERCLGL